MEQVEAGLETKPRGADVGETAGSVSARGVRSPTAGAERSDRSGAYPLRHPLLLLILLLLGGGSVLAEIDAVPEPRPGVDGSDPGLAQQERPQDPGPLLLDPRPEAHTKTNKPAWNVDPYGSIRWVIVVRRAEGADEPAQGPPLSPEGDERARLLERMLLEAHPTLLLGTELSGTKETLQPLAEKLGLLVDVHDFDDPYGLAARIVEMERPVSVIAAGGESIVPILEALTQLSLENLHPIGYDDLFVVAIAPGVPRSGGRLAASVLRLKYGS